MSRGIAAHLRDYCSNSTLAGVDYIANQKLHLTERFFWFLCIAISTICSWLLIRQYQNDFESNSISMVVEGIRMQKTQFPSIGICELGYPRHQYDKLEEIIESFRNGSEDIPYSYDVEDYLLRIVFQNVYSYGSLAPYCLPHLNCIDCMKCPALNYRKYSEKIRAKCQELFVSCKWNGNLFDCCKHFHPLHTSMGKCFLLNSRHTAKVGSKRWLNADIDWDNGIGVVEIVVRNSAAVHILNEEDVPHLILTTLQDNLLNAGYERYLQLQVTKVMNDPDIREVSPRYRKCRFPDELLPDSTYNYYSYSTCVTDCLKQAQIKACNCANYNLIGSDDDKTPPCNLTGILCLDNIDLIYPQTKKLQPWHKEKFDCMCLPSCDEHEIRIVEKSFVIQHNNQNRNVTIAMQSLPTKQYRRQAVRTRLDAVVTIGGILGLFMGASILSGIELLYFFTVRVFGNNSS